MDFPNSIQKKAPLTGLLLVFLLSAVVMPALSAERDFDSQKTLHFSSHQDSDHTPAIPLPLPEEEKEEENRTEKSRALVIPFISVVLELQATGHGGPTAWEFNHTNASAVSDFPLYLHKQSLLI